jgi:hypothetical protein
MAHEVLKKLLVLLFVFASLFAAAQPDSVRASKSLSATSVHVLANAGMVAGKSGRDFQVQAIASVPYKSWFAGIGGGLDYYYWRTVPLFVDVRKTFSKPHALFLYGDAGWDLPWIKKSMGDSWYQQHFESGLYYDIGGGWNFKMGRRNGLLLSTGYSGKNLNEIRNANPAKTKITYALRRITVKLGFQF